MASFFVFRGNPTQLQKDLILQPILEREKANHPDRPEKESIQRATELTQSFWEDMRAALPAWQTADFLWDNTDFANPRLG